MLFKTKDKPHQKQTQLGVEEAHRIWTKAQSRYIIINHIKFISNFVHDKDFKLILNNINSLFANHCEVFEDKMNKHSIKSPEPDKTEVELLVNQESISDKQIARTIFGLLQNALSECFQALYDASFNDNIWELLFSLTKEEIELFYDYMDYLILKGWLEYPPLYPNVKEKQSVAANVVWQLWHHLNFRYLNIQQTRIMVKHVTNKDFQLILNAGITILEKQTVTLEKMLIDYGVNLPEKYPKNFPTPESKEIFDDEYIYNVLLSAIKNATTIHGFAIRELIINDQPRKLFKDLLYEEIGLLGKLIKYGKIKGWIPQSPVYRS